MTSINLLPWREQARKKNQRVAITSILVYTTLIVIVAFLIHSHFAGKVKRQLDQNRALQKKIIVANSTVAKLKRLVKPRDELMRRIRLLQGLQEARFFAVTLFNEITRITPRLLPSFLVSLFLGWCTGIN